ncbi:hypothetical protein [Roseomonas gilardii]|uniref:hypothetical protein n=1 Tax=Roseomonas gilardii TaxID=257708 RepID=UPI0012EBDFF4|nr:hypothetical protein [Roseomonas gilardii]
MPTAALAAIRSITHLGAPPRSSSAPIGNLNAGSASNCALAAEREGHASALAITAWIEATR